MFFNRKEEVLDIQLTARGRKLLAEGFFSPEYYDFFDTDVLYDSRYGGSEENQNSVQTRIKESTRTKAQSSYGSAENTDKSARAKGYQYPLGTTDGYSIYAPAIGLTMLKGAITGSEVVNSGSSFDEFIPQITSIVQYETTIQDGFVEQQDRLTLDQSFFAKPFSDDSFLLIEGDFILLRMEELNTIFGNENFTYEVFEVEEIDGQEELKPLRFADQKSFIQNNLLVDDELPPAEIDITNVEFFLDIRRDEEISDEILCKYLPNDRPNNVFEITRKCKESEVESMSMYNSNVTEDDIEC